MYKLKIENEKLKILESQSDEEEFIMSSEKKLDRKVTKILSFILVSSIIVIIGLNKVIENPQYFYKLTGLEMTEGWREMLCCISLLMIPVAISCVFGLVASGLHDDEFHF